MSELEQAWDKFIRYMSKHPSIEYCYYKHVTGIPFIYIKVTSISRNELEEILKLAAAKAMKGKRLTLSMYYVRENEAYYVYHVRFLVPQQKMFCCGNMCVDCIRLEC
ncbi:hypothetical protein [Pontibacillus yanchengensis]|uniref:Uncharacterized protein n=1 Tax=Pontibacillus yanchengensis Y32 TaxID=1385514 RepID=A0A0A2TA86_9BACI|nr:hypothetical protein [Pontibacillus yanchengensis]KGP72454.1 hypothetical protein N782_06000 [Pontibacillus yanchengensis Y32]